MLDLLRENMKLHVCNSCHSVTTKRYSICLICGNDPKTNKSYDEIRKGYNHYINWVWAIAISLWVFFYFASRINPMLNGISFCCSILMVFSFLTPIIVDSYFSRRIEKIKNNQMLKIVISPILSLQNVALPNDLGINELESKLNSPINKSKIARDTQKKYKIYVLIKIMMNNIRTIIEDNDGSIIKYKTILQESLDCCEKYEADISEYLGTAKLHEIENIIYRLRLLIAMDNINKAGIDKSSIEIVSLIEEVMKDIDFEEALSKL